MQDTASLRAACSVFAPLWSHSSCLMVKARSHLTQIASLEQGFHHFVLLSSWMCMSLDSGRKLHRPGIALKPTIFSPWAQQLHTCIVISNTNSRSYLLLSCSRRETHSLCQWLPSTRLVSCHSHLSLPAVSHQPTRLFATPVLIFYDRLSFVSHLTL